jgi:hypothetical protein
VKTDLTIDATPGLAARKAAARLLAAVVDAKTGRSSPQRCASAAPSRR